ncbi:MAG: hypothetical protein ACI85O_001034 [Saprospiraceae bacterium]|jgi:hypothetical protein
MKQLFTIITLLIFSLSMQAQGFGYGFKTGLNFNRIQSDSIRVGEELAQSTGFHIGAVFAYKFTDLMGVRGELLYSIRGGRLRYDGDDVFGLVSSTGRFLRVDGNRASSIRVTNSYIDIPLTFYYKPASWLELSVGAQAGFLIGSTAVGQIIIDGETTISGQNFDVDKFDFNVNYNYNKDVFDDPTLAGGSTEVAGESVILPSSLGAYSEFTEDYGKLFRSFDFALIGGASLFLNKGLFVSGRANIGFTDITNDEADRVNAAVPGTSTAIVAEKQNHIDTNFAVQVSVGFIF